MRINHNIPALRALHQMSKTNASLDKTLERLSSGLRINHAADDAAGLAISQKMDTQVRGLKQANRNAMDGISLIQTAEGALNEVHSMLQRIRELSVQVSNGTYDSTDRKAVQDEVKQLQSEIERISNNIEFNERKLLNGEIDRRAFPDDETVAQIVSLTDTVEPGTYTISINADAEKAKIEGTKSTFTGTAIDVANEGKINLNGEETQIKQGDTAEVVFDKVRTLAETVGANLIAYEDNAGKPNYAAGAKPFEFNHNMHLIFEMKEYGSEYKLDLNTSNNTLLNNLGLSTMSVTGKDVKASVDTVNSDFGSTATVTTKGNAITVRDVNGFEMKFDAQDSTATSNTVYSDAVNKAKSRTFTSTNTYPVAQMEQAAKVAVSTYMQAIAVGKNDTDAKSAVESAITNEVPTIASADVTEMANSMTSLILGDTTNDPPTNGAAKVAYDTAVAAGAVSGAGKEAATAALDLIAGAKAGDTDLQLINRAKTKGLTEEQAKIAVNAFKAVATNHTKIKVLDAGPLNLQIGANEGQFMEVRVQNLSPKALGIDKLNLSTTDGAQKAITIADNAINMISSVRSKLGAYQNRLEHTVKNLDAAAENMTASLSRIQDADMAQEMAEYTQKNIISQAGVSMLAQANQRPQQILQLLQR